MNTMIEQYQYLKKQAWAGRWSQRILSELYYLIELSRTRENAGRELLEEVTADLVTAVEQNGAITRADTLAAEQKLESLSPMAKSLEVILAGHAHIDMNWMWGYQETVSVTLDTFRTMLELMEEYPRFTFSQSQASTYRIVEEYAPQMLPAIRRRVKEGRWEVNASSWVENDRNMTGSESTARQILYAREYLSRLLELPEEAFTLDFEPDTFGHNENVPEMLTQGGIRWYYHCRGYDGDFIYRWRAPSGAELLVYRKPMWYNDTESRGDCLGFVPEICSRYGISKVLKLFGVGDHGGGNLMIKVYNSLPDEEIDYESDVTVHVDGSTRQVPAGSFIRLTPSESLWITQGMYHSFTPEEGTGSVLVGEVSQCNDDNTDNRFNPPVGRFPEIEEDEPPYRLLCNEYPAGK